MADLTHRTLRRALLTLCAILLLATGARAQEEESRKLDAVKAVLDGAEQTLSAPIPDDSSLGELIGRVDAARGDIAGVNEALSPRLQAINTRIAQLGEKPPEGGAPESPELAQEREAQLKARQPLDETLKRAGALLVQSEQVSQTIAQKRRDLFATRVLLPTQSLLNPSLWLSVVDEIPRRVAAAQALFRQWGDQVEGSISRGRGVLALGSVVLAILLVWPLRKLIHSLGQRYAVEQVHASRLRRSGLALWVIFINTAAPVAAATALYYGFLWDGFILDRAVPFVDRVWRLSLFVSFVAGLTRGILSPHRPSWRVPPLSDAVVDRLSLHPVWIAITFAVARAIQAFLNVIGAGLATTIVTDGLAAVAIAVQFALALQPAKAAQEEQPAIAGEGNWLYGTARVVAWLAIFAVLGSLLVGYISLGFFLATQMLWVSVIGAVLYMLLVLSDDLLCGCGPQTRVGRFARVSIGLRSERVDQICALLSGILRLTLIVLAALLAAAPWGIQSGDAASWFRQALLGFTLAGFSLSPRALLASIAVLVVGVLLTRSVQAWLDRRYLPHTRLDPGLKNSIRTATGYAGFIIAAALALSSLGFGVEKFAIVAGALSVGIGFGLQAIVSNFVSGLILLAERPIRVGDWVGIGTDEGNVRRISVRSTVIEMFDRSTLIVPNSDLITKPVRNWTHQNTVGRVQISIGTSFEVSVEDVKGVLLDEAHAHPSVLDQPAPDAMIVSTTDVGVQWRMFCYVSNPRQVASARSDLYFAVLKRLQSKGMRVTAAPS